MSRRVLVDGRVTGERTVEVKEALPERLTGVEVVLHVPEPPTALQDWIDFFASLPPGMRSKEDIDRQIEEDRSSS